MSVVLAAVAALGGCGPHDVLGRHDRYGLASITAGLARAYRQGIARDPTPQEPAHAVVFGKKTKSTKRALAKQAQWVVPLADRC